MTPWRTHSSTSVRAKAVVASRLMEGCLRDDGLRLRARVHAERTRRGPPIARSTRRVALRVPDDLDFVATARRGWATRAARATYVGYSQGGRLCLQLALDRPDLVDELVLVSASPGIADDAERAARATSRRVARARDRARRRRRVPRALAGAAAVRHALPRARRRRGSPRREHRRAPGASAHGAGAGRAAVELGPAGRARDAGAAVVGVARHQVRRHRRPHGRSDPERARRGHRGRRATRVTSSNPTRSLTCSSFPVAREQSSPSGATVRTAQHAVARGRAASWVTSPASCDERGQPARRTAAPGARPRARLRRRCRPTSPSSSSRPPGRPAASATASAARTPPSGCCFSTITSAASSARQAACVVERADALVGRDRHVDPRAAPQRRSSSDRHRLLDVARGRTRARRVIIVDRGVDVPRAVGVDAQRHAGADRVAHRARRARRPGASRTFTFTAGKPRTCLHEERAVDERVHRHAVAHGGREAARGRLLGRGAGRPQDRSDSPRAASTRPSRPDPRAA